MTLVFIISLLLFTTALAESGSNETEIVLDEPAPASEPEISTELYPIELRFPKPTQPFVLHKNGTFLSERNGTVAITFQTNGAYDEATEIATTKAIKIELEIKDEEPGKLYSDFSFDSWPGNPLTEIIGKPPGERHEFVLNWDSITFQYNETAPNFTLTATEIPELKGCECGVMSFEFPEGIPNPTRHPTAILTLEMPKNCSNLVCAWDSERDIKKGQDIKFSFLGEYDNNDQFYIRTSNRTLNLLPESKEAFKRFEMPFNDPFVIYFIGGKNPEKDRRMNLEYTYETEEF